MKKLHGILLTSALLAAGVATIASFSAKSEVSETHAAATEWNISNRLPNKSEMSSGQDFKLVTDVVLTERWSADTTSTSAHSASLDLNGHSIYLQKDIITETSDEHVMTIERKLNPFTIKDSNPDSVHYVSYDETYGRVNRIETTEFPGSTLIKGGVICGGYSAYSIGGISVNDTNFNFKGGSITGCVSKQGGAAIWANEAGSISSPTSLTIEGGKIFKNKAPEGAAVYVTCKCILKLKGGAIEDNEAAGIEIDVYEDRKGTFELYQSGNPVVRNNKVGELDRNIVLNSDRVIEIKETLTNTEPYGVSHADGTGVVTSGLKGKGTLANFKSDDPDSQLVLDSDEVKVVAKKVVTYDANGGTGSTVDPNKYEDGDTVEILNSAFTAPEGKVFAGWNRSADGTGASYVPGQEVTIYADLKLYAQWGKPIVANIPSPAPNYDGEAHSNVIEVTDPEDGYVIKYGEIAGNYNLDECPSYTDVGEHEVYYKVTADGYADLVGSFTINIRENDKSELNSLIQEAEALIAKIKELDPELAAQLQEALNNAKKTSEDKNVTTSKIEEALHGLQVQVTKADEVVNKKSGLPGWALALIIVGSLLAVLGIAYCLLFFVLNKWIKKDGKAIRVFPCGKKGEQVRLFTMCCKVEYRKAEEVFKSKAEALK